MPASQLDVDHLFTLTAAVNQDMHVVGNGPFGTRVVATVTGGTVEGPRVKGKLEGAGGDWVVLAPSGVGHLDVRITIVTDDGANILMTYRGVLDPASGAIRTAPSFETGDERYAWLNDLQAVGLGERIEGGVRYEVYALK